MAVTVVLAVSGCSSQWTYVVKRDRISGGDEPFVSSKLELAPDAAFVVRAGGSSAEAIGSRASVDQSAAELEVQLQRAGFTVRDRQLVEARLRQAATVADYGRIADDTGIEYIAEIVNVREGFATSMQGFELADGKVKRGPEDGLESPQWEVTVDLVRVRDNSRVGRLVGVAHLFTIAEAQGDWPFADPRTPSPVQGVSDSQTLGLIMTTARKVPGAFCEYDSHGPRACKFKDPSVPLRHALADVAKQIAASSGR